MILRLFIPTSWKVPAEFCSCLI